VDGKLILLALAAFALSGDDEPAKLPEPEGPGGEEPTPGGGIGGIVFPPPGGGGGGAPPPPNNAGTLPATLTSLTSPTPRMGAAYQVRDGDVLLGPGGIVGKALVSEGLANTAQNRTRYLQAMTRVRSNWVLYATDGTSSQVDDATVTDSSGQTTKGDITAAMLRMHDSWGDAAAAGELPNRLIKFTRQVSGNNKVPVPMQGWQQRAHGGAATARVYGRLWLPPALAMNQGPLAFQNAAYDWPVQLWLAAGADQKTYNGEP
jgi:hypothetical protein